MLVLTADELRVAAKVSGSSVPGAVNGGWAEEDLAVADVVALRGLLARGLASARDVDSGIEVSLTAAAHDTLGPLLRPDLVIEVIRDTAISAQRWLVGQTADTAVVAEEREPDVWRLRPAGQPAHQVVAAIVTELISEFSPNRIPTGTSVTVRTSALIDAERHRMTSEPAAITAGLVDAGLSADDATTLATVLADINAFITVRLVNRVDGPPTADALTWLEAGASGTWLAVPKHADEPNDDPAVDREHQHIEDLPYLDELDPITELNAVSSTEIRAALAELLDAAPITLAASCRGIS
jgi:hypothetical protein